MNLHYLTYAAHQLLELHREAAAESDDDDTMLQAGILYSIITALQLLSQHDSSDDLAVEAKAYVRATNTTLGIQDWMDEVQKVVIEASQPGKSHLLERPLPPMPTRLRKTSTFGKLPSDGH